MRYVNVVKVGWQGWEFNFWFVCICTTRVQHVTSKYALYVSKQYNLHCQKETLEVLTTFSNFQVSGGNDCEGSGGNDCEGTYLSSQMTAFKSK